MYRLMQSSDLEPMKTLYSAQYGRTEAFAERAICDFAGQENAYVAEENGEITACVLAVPVTLQEHSGSYLYGLCFREGNEGTAMGLVDHVCAERSAKGASFTVCAPSAEQMDFYAKRGFAKAFTLRCLKREVRRNLWSQAEFDTVTAKRLCELRNKFCPNSVQTDAERMSVVLTDLYSRGITIVSNEDGYGLYFREEDTLYFIEMMAKDDHAAEELMEAAREKESIVERAVITVGAAQQLFGSEGSCMDYGMIRFDGEPFDVSESYMRLMMEN
jgi:hypothetical protein